MYKSMVKVILILLSLTIWGFGSLPVEKLIILGDTDNLNSAKLLSKKAQRIISSDSLLSEINISTDKMPRVMSEDKDYIIVFGPFADNKQLAVIYFQTKKLFPDAVLVSLISSAPKTKKEIVYTTIDTPSQDTDWSLWIALFALAVIGILALFFSSLQINRILQQHRIMRKRQEEMEIKQHELFSKLGENIYSMSKDMIENTQKVISDIGDEKAPKELKEMVLTENKILDTTNNLLEFLKIKSKKVTIEHEKFKINNMLDDLVGSFVGKYPQKDIELVLDIEHSLPVYAIGDFTNTVNILRNLIEHQFSLMERGEVVLSISIDKPYQDNSFLEMKITPYGEIEHENISEENYFVPQFVDETGTYSRLGLYVAYELVSLMEGDIIAKKLPNGGAVIELSIPVGGLKEERRKYRLPSKKYTQKSVYITNRHYHASVAQKNLFEYFRHKVTIDTADDFVKERPNLSEYDIVLIDCDLIYPGFETYSQMLREKYDVKMVCMENILQGESKSLYSYLFDKSVKKPLNQEHVFLLILNLYSKEIKEEFGDKEKNRNHKREFISNVEEKPNVKIQDLADFAGTKILVAEDNEINQRMIDTVLRRAGIYIDIASNGEEALHMIEDKGSKYYDLVLMDINMPIMDGFTATKKIRELQGVQSLPIVSLTALVLEHEIDKMKASDMDAFLPKPINIGKLYTVLDIFVGKNRDKAKDNIAVSQHKRDIDGLDIDVGLKMSGGNPIFYRELLKEFLEVYGESGKVAVSLYEQKRLEALQQLMLDIMGLSGTIGAKDLYHAANEIYKLYLYNKLELLPGFIKKYNEEMERVKNSILEYLNE